MKPWYEMLILIAMMLASYVGHEIVFAIDRSDLLRASPPATSAPAAGVAMEQAARSSDRAVIGTLTARESHAI
jgi:hypothetical protein